MAAPSPHSFRSIQIQKSSSFVLYKHTAFNKEKEPTATTYFKQIQWRNGPDDKETPDLSKAVTMDKASAFKLALGEKPGWSVGELVSDRHGIRVEE